MISRFITEVNTKFNPFSSKAKAARLFLTFLPPNARSQGMNISTTLLPRGSTEPSKLYIKFSKSLHPMGFVFLGLCSGHDSLTELLQRMERK